MSGEILLLNDKKAGHQNQAKAMIKEIEEIFTAGSKSVPSIRILQPGFKSKLHERFFAFFIFFAYPFVKENIPWIKKFIRADAAEGLSSLNPGIVVAAGSGTIPISLAISKIHNSKRIFLMNPAFPFSLFRFDLAIVPQHDVTIKGKNVFNALLALSPFDRDLINRQVQDLKAQLSVPERVQIGVLVGGTSKNYEFNQVNMDLAIDQINEAAKKLDADFIVTTCRRTPIEYENRLKTRLAKIKNCQLFIPADRDKATNIVSAIIGLCKIIISTEESISMISEPVSAGKKTIILKLNSKLYNKYARFHRMLLKKNLAHAALYDGLKDKIIEVHRNSSYDLNFHEKAALDEEKKSLRNRLSFVISRADSDS